MRPAEKVAESVVSMIAPSGWYEDVHERGSRPRCCEAIKSVRITLDAVGHWSPRDASELAEIIVDGMTPPAPRGEGK